MGFENPVVGGTALRIPAIQSPNFQSGTSGWIIRIDGSAEFNNLTIRGTFQGNDFILNSSGLFIYSGTPANGNLIASIAPASGTDSFGNTYLVGVVSYAGTTFSALASGNLFFGLTANGYPKAGQVSLTGTDGAFISSPFNTQPNQAAIELDAGDNTVTPTSASGYPHLDVGAGTAGITQWIHGAIVHATANGGVSTADTWQTPSLGSGWAAGPSGGSFRSMKYRRDAEDNLVLSGVFHTTSTTPAASPFTLASGWRPAAGERPGVTFNHAGTYTAGSLEIATSGVCTIDPVPTSASTDVYLYAAVPLGNIG